LERLPINLHLNDGGLIEAAETVREDLPSCASKATFHHAEMHDLSSFNVKEDIDLLQSVADGKRPLMLEPELADLIKGAYHRHANDVQIVYLFKQAVDAYTKAMLDATIHLAP
jgi:hypothetical protein